jgi:glycine/D-amino acid oxidase-like deaminating enzyme
VIYDLAGYDSSVAPKSYWHATCAPVACGPPLTGYATADVVVVGAGYAGLNAALELVERFGARVHVLDAATPGWGASGRNGGFCCLGGAKMTDAEIAARVGTQGAAEWSAFEHSAIDRVCDNLSRYAIDAQVTEAGEVLLADSARAWVRMQRTERGHGVWAARELAARGLASQVYHGGRYVPAGFGLHPMAYVTGLARAALAAGVTIWPHSAATKLERHGTGWLVHTAQGTIRAARVLVATNGYSDERLVPWLARRLVPAISNILVTRSLTADERAAQGWTRTLMAYDNRHMLHYFRLLPDNRFLFGARGGLSFAAPSVAKFAARARAEFDLIFPAFAQARTEYSWNGLVCLTSSRAPYIGPVPDTDGLWLALGWHGNGVAAASDGGRRVAHALMGGADTRPALVRRPPPRLFFPRRAALGLGMGLGSLVDGPLRARAL